MNCNCKNCQEIYEQAYEDGVKSVYKILNYKTDTFCGEIVEKVIKGFVYNENRGEQQFLGPNGKDTPEFQSTLLQVRRYINQIK